MSELDDAGRRLLGLLAQRLKTVRPGRPDTYLGYRECHTALGLRQLRDKWGDSLTVQGMGNLAEWALAAAKPALTGIIVNKDPNSDNFNRPGNGYFELYGRSKDDFGWWEDEVRRAKSVDWMWFVSARDDPTPEASDIAAPPKVTTITYRVLRDTELARRIKRLHDYRCQICAHTIVLPSGEKYAEAHHIRPLGTPHNGPDVADNIICVCPNHHAELDYGVSELSLSDLRTVDGHSAGEAWVRYHNEQIARRGR